MITKLMTAFSLLSCVSTLGMEAGRSRAVFTLEGKHLSGKAVFAWEDIDSVLELDFDRNGSLDENELAQSALFLDEYGGTLYNLRKKENGRGLLLPTSVASAWHAGSGTITFHLAYQSRTAWDSESLVIDFAGYRDFAAGHGQHIELRDGDGRLLWEKQDGEPSARSLFPSVEAVAAPAPVRSPAKAPFPSGMDRVWFSFAIGFLLIALSSTVWFIRRMAAA